MKIMKIHNSIHKTLSLEKEDIERKVNRLYELLVESVKYLENETLIPREPYNGIYSITPLYESDEQQSIDELLYFPKYLKRHRLVGIDSTIHPIGESKKGFLFAIRGSIVSDIDGCVSIDRYGPLLFYLSIDNIDHIADTLRLNIKSREKILEDLIESKKLTIAIFERILLKEAIELSPPESVILIDGSLSRRLMGQNIFDDYLMYRAFKNKMVYVAGVSKKSRLYKRYPHLISALYQFGEATAIKVPFKPLSYVSAHNHVFIAKFGLRSIPLRIDIPRYIEEPHLILDAIFTGASYSTGYPDVLKEAHVTSKLVKNELLSLKILARRFGGRFIDSSKIRDILFGSFNRSSSDWVGKSAVI